MTNSNGNNSKFKQATRGPTRKVTFGAFAGALTAILVWILNTFEVLPNATQIPGEIASAMTTVLTFLVSYLVPPSPSDGIVEVE
jgi:Na+/proline symporter